MASTAERLQTAAGQTATFENETKTPNYSSEKVYETKLRHDLRKCQLQLALFEKWWKININIIRLTRFSLFGRSCESSKTWKNTENMHARELEPQQLRKINLKDLIFNLKNLIQKIWDRELSFEFLLSKFLPAWAPVDRPRDNLKNFFKISLRLLHNL